MRQETKKQKAGEEKHNRAPDARAAEVGNQRRRQSEEYKLD
jgi:hypothetical protein